MLQRSGIFVVNFLISMLTSLYDRIGKQAYQFSKVSEIENLKIRAIAAAFAKSVGFVVLYVLAIVFTGAQVQFLAIATVWFLAAIVEHKNTKS